MTTTRKILTSAAVAGGIFLMAVAAIAQTPPDNMKGVPGPLVNITPNGHVVVRGAKVTNMATGTITAVLSWGSAGLTFTLNTNSQTEFVRQAGGHGSLSEIAKDHIISFEGEVVTSASAFSVNARYIRDWSVLKMNVNQFGVVKSIDMAGKKFVLDAQEKERGDITVMVSDATKFMKQKATTTLAVLKTGDKVIVSGLWDRAANTLQADMVRVQVENRRVFEGGKLKSVASSTPPTSMIVTFGAFDYTVMIDANTALLNNNWARVSLSDMKVGDNIRVYGAADGTTIAATVVRDASIK